MRIARHAIDRLVAPMGRSLRPTSIAVDGAGESLSYAELDTLANRFARLFSRMGGSRSATAWACTCRVPLARWQPCLGPPALVQSTCRSIPARRPRA
jgi:non-ribosomal peptide synthetase component F